MQNEHLRHERRNHPAARALALAALLALSAASGAHGAEPGAAASVATVADSLNRIESETLLLKAQERQMAVKLQLAQQHSDLAQRQADANRLAHPGRVGDPTVLAVESIGRNAWATLQMENGGTVDVTSGDALPNGMTVLSIRAGEVLVLRGKRERIRLAAAAVGATPAAAQQAAGAKGPQWTLPPLPPLPGAPAVAQRGAGQ